jgi:clan AA aspartic protease
MGLFHVSGRLTGPTGRSETIESLVDTGTALLLVPRELAERLDLRRAWDQPVEMADGREALWPEAEVRLALDGREITTQCFICPGGSPLLGAGALESLFLSVDPVRKRLVPVKGFAG